MIIVTGQQLQFLLRGRPLKLEVHREYRRDRDYAVGKTVRKATCRAIVQEIERIGGKTWRITIRQATGDRPVYLAANPAAQRADYTENPAKAARAPNGGPLEAVDTTWLPRVSKAARERDDLLRRERAHQARIARRRVA